MANYILRKETEIPDASIWMHLVPMQVDEDILIRDDFQKVLINLLPHILILLYVVPMYRTIATIVQERVRIIQIFVTLFFRTRVIFTLC